MLRQLVILAGGQGRRLAAITGSIPKALVQVGGQPVLQHQLLLAAENGITDVRIFAGYLGDQIQEFVGDGSKFNLRVRVDVESRPMGNAGALLQGLDSLDENFLVVYGDVMLSANLRRFAEIHSGNGADFTLVVHPNDHPHDSDLVEVDVENRVTHLRIYPHSSDGCYRNLVNAGLYGVRREALRPALGTLPKSDFTKDVLPALLASGAKVSAYRSMEYIKDMGTPERLESVEHDWRFGRIRPRTAGTLNRAVFFDRDGTLNVERGFVRSSEQFTLYAGAGEALRRLRAEGYRLVVVTNQPVIARGEATPEDVLAVHSKLEWELGKSGAFLDGIYVCPHHPDRGFPGERTELKGLCRCRKPSTGLVDQACEELDLDRTRSWMIGDRTGDVEMARRANLRSILVQTGAAGRDGKYPVLPDFTAEDLASAADLILNTKRHDPAMERRPRLAIP